MGARWASVLKMYGQASLRAVADQNLPGAKELADQFKNCRVFSDPRQGKHVLSEKPAGVSSRELAEAVKTAKKRRLSYMVGFNHRFHPGYLLAKKIIKTKKIGDILFIRARYGFGGRLGYEKEWRMNKNFSGGGELLDQGVHMIDLCRMFLGNFHKVCGLAENLYWNSSVDDNAFLILKNKQNQIASIHVSWTNWDPIHNFEIYGTLGYIRIEGLGNAPHSYGKEKLTLGLRSKNYFDAPKEKEFLCGADRNQSLLKELQEFISSIREKRVPRPSGEDGYQALKIVEKIYKK
ncbi:MAG: Oxidoreductase domain protein [Candidatus Giovannonibacteria bacterium GW2011_GWA1_43_15]|nr:MAG: Oxidoreductase domain protein [Candidatus Giovannonibacteria bacterium GW2011_GWA1_43_15]